MIYFIAFISTWFITFTLFLAIMAARKARDEQALLPGNKIVWYTCLLILGIGLISDFMLNMLLSVRFLELPQEILATARVKRHKNFGAGWRKRLAEKYCAEWLTPFDKPHCER